MVKFFDNRECGLCDVKWQGLAGRRRARNGPARLGAETQGKARLNLGKCSLRYRVGAGSARRSVEAWQGTEEGYAIGNYGNLKHVVVEFYRNLWRFCQGSIRGGTPGAEKVSQKEYRMRRSLSLIRNRVMVALRAACAGSHGATMLLDELAKIDEQIEREQERDEAFKQLHEAQSREQLENAVNRVRASIHGVDEARSKLHRAMTKEEIESMKSLDEVASEFA